jgi:hypothetical protein
MRPIAPVLPPGDSVVVEQPLAGVFRSLRAQSGKYTLRQNDDYDVDTVAQETTHSHTHTSARQTAG